MLAQKTSGTPQPAEYLELLRVVAVAANQAASIEEAMQTCIDSVCRLTGWPVGHLYLVARDDPNRLVPTSVWHINNPVPMEQMQATTERTSFDAGAGLPGRVLQSGRPSWIVDVSRDGNFPRVDAARRAGLRAGFAFPVLAGSSVAGVLEFFSPVASEPDQGLLDIMADVGVQLGRVVEREHAQEALRTSELRFRSVAESANDAIISADRSGRIISWNKGAATIFGYEEAEVLGKPLTILMPERYRPLHTSGMERFQTTGEAPIMGKTVEMAGLRKDGTEFPLELSLATWSTSEGTFYTGIIRDMTERRRAQEQIKRLNEELERRVAERTAELQAQAAILQTILDVTPVGIAFGDTNLRIINCNAAWAEAMGVDAESVRGQIIYDAIPATRSREALHRRVLEGESFDMRDLEVQLPGEERPRYYDVHMRPLRGEEHAEEAHAEVAGILTAAVEVTYRHELSRQKDDFIALASHELKTPITLIKGYAQVGLRAAQTGDERMMRILRIINHQSDRTADLINDLLDISRIQRDKLSLDLEELDLGEVVDEVVANLRLVAPDFDLRLERAPGPLPVSADRHRIEQVISNVVENAVKYSGESRVVEIAVESRDGEVVTSVRDHGVGIPAEQIPYVFERFFQAANLEKHQSGLGVGLFISSSIVSRHGGRMWVESTEGEGSTFYFALPLPPCTRPGRQGRSAKPPGAPCGSPPEARGGCRAFPAVCSTWLRGGRASYR